MVAYEASLLQAPLSVDEGTDGSGRYPPGLGHHTHEAGAPLVAVVHEEQGDLRALPTPRAASDDHQGVVIHSSANQTTPNGCNNNHLLYSHRIRFRIFGLSLAMFLRSQSNGFDVIAHIGLGTLRCRMNVKNLIRIIWTLRRQSGKNSDCNTTVVVLYGFFNCIIIHAVQELRKVE